MSSSRMDKFGPYVKALRALQDDNRLRGLNSRAGIDFSSNDYLALASASHMKKAVLAAIERGTPLGSGGSRLLRGNCQEHECLEAEAAHFFGAETALFFASGYVANFAVLTHCRSAAICSSSTLWFTPVFMKARELAGLSFA